MARKTAISRKPAIDNDETATEAAVDNKDGLESAAGSSHEDDAPPSKAKIRSSDDQSAGSNVGIGDIRKAVAFSNSVGGLEKAIALLQILKVAKEVQ